VAEEIEEAKRTKEKWWEKIFKEIKRWSPQSVIIRLGFGFKLDVYLSMFGRKLFLRRQELYLKSLLIFMSSL
jgi:hypothetical protein